MNYRWLYVQPSLSICLSITIAMLEYFCFLFSQIKRFPFLVTIADAIISAYFHWCGMSTCAVDLDDQTTMHYWTARHRRFSKPALVLIHGYGSTAQWQFVRQVGSLSESFNLFIPDLLFFGESHTKLPDRSVEFQAKCVGEGLKRLGVERCSMYAISYGGWVGYQMAEMYPGMVEKVVIVSTGVGFTEEQRVEQLGKVGTRNMKAMLCPEKPEDLRLLAKQTMHKLSFHKWVPDFFLWEYINVMCKTYRKERLQLVEYLIAMKADNNLPSLTQETLLIWGDQDNVFPLFLGRQLQRHLGPRSKLEIIKDTGHGANMESPDLVNALIKSFVLGSPKVNGSYDDDT